MPPQYYRERAMAKSALGLIEEAIEDYTQAIELITAEYDPEYDRISLFRIYLERAMAKSALGLIEEAQEDVDIASELEAQARRGG